MAYPSAQNGWPRSPVQDRYWILGANTLVSPTDINQGGYYWLENGVNRGGVMQTRPGKHLIFSLPGRRAQGLCIYRPYRQKEQLVWAIDGQIFFSQYPFTGAPTKIPGIQFYKDSPQVFFCQCRQAVTQNADGSLTLLPQPIDMLIIQDGYTASAFYIATSSNSQLQAGHNKAGGPWFQCPVGTAMAYSGSRLWVANMETVYASDLLNPNSFTEGTYLAEADGFKLPEPCSGMLEIPGDPSSNVAPGLLAFSPFAITSLQSSVLDRTTWQQTPNFQTIVSKDYGSVSAWSPVNNFGMPWFFSEVGFTRLDEALNQYRSSGTNPRDMEMLRSKQNMSPDRTMIATVAFENWLLCAVPSGSRWNRHTWVLDGAAQAQLGGSVSPCWVGIWTGTYPVQFAAGEIQDVPRCFELSYSCGPIPPNPQAGQTPNHIHLWEDFIGRRTDNSPYNDNPISCSWETKIFEVSQVGELCRFKYAELDVVELIGNCSIQIYYAGIKGHYRKILDILLAGEEGLPGSQEYPLWTYQSLATDTEFDTYKPQTRTVKTPEQGGASQEDDGCSDTCGIESQYQLNVDKGFQLMINWQGRMGIRELRLFVEPYPQPGIGKCTDDETGECNIVSAIGCLPPPNVCVIPVP